MQRNLSLQQITEIENSLVNIPGFQIIEEPGRNYQRDQPHHLIGHLAEIGSKDIKKPEYEAYSKEDLVGKKGLEKIHENLLIGKRGFKIINVDATGNVVTSQVNSYTKRPIPGHNIHLTIDNELQKFVFQSFRHKRGVVIAMDPQNGQILAIKSSPTYPPDLFQSQLSQKSWKQISENPFAPLVNKAIRAEYPPGSLYKVIVGLAALEEGYVTEHTSKNCTGHFEVGNEKFRCHKRSGHGSVNLSEALRYSCDSYFYQVGLD